MQRKSFVTTAAVMAGLVLGIIFGPSVRSYIASAQTPSPAPTQSASPADSLWNLFLDSLAEALNIQRSALDSAITSAGTSTADEAVQQGLLTQEQAGVLKNRIQSGDMRPFWGGRHGFWGGHGRRMGGPHMSGETKQAMLDAAAQTLNISTDELLTQLRSGQTLEQLAQAQGTTVEAVTEAALAAARTQLDEAVSDGTLTQEQANEIYAHLQQHGLRMLEFRGRGFGHSHRGWRSKPITPRAPVEPMTPEAPAATPEASDA
jgi:hypothetical protein